MPCSISSFTANYVPNSCDGEIILIEFDFIATDFGTNGFTVETAGLSPQFFNIGDFYELYEISYCSDDVVLIIKDFDDPNCMSQVNIGPACCDCEITDPVLEATICSEGLFDIQIDLDAYLGTCVNYDWYVTIEGIDYDLDYNSSAGYFEAIDIQAVSPVLTVMLCNESPLNECYSYLLDNPCYNEPCVIQSFTAEVDTSSCLGEIVGITFDFMATGFGTNGFTVSDGTGSEYYNLGDDYIFYTTSECNQDIVLSVYDADDASCIATVDVQAECCSCEVLDFTATTTACLNNTFNIVVDLNIESGSCLWYSWFVTIEGIDYDLEWIGNEFIAQNIMAQDSVLTAMICTTAPTAECYSIEIENPCFIPNDNCQITSFIAAYDTLSCAGEGIDITFDFNAIDFGQNGFSISTSQFTQNYQIGEDYIYTLISQCTDSIEVTITDNDNPACTSTIVLPPACCPCMISDPNLNTTACNAGTFDIEIDFSIESGSCINNDWYVSVEGQDYTLSFNGSIFIAEDIIAMDSIITISLCTTAATRECFDYDIENPCFVSASTCVINSFTASYDTTSCVGEILNIDFDFNAIDFGQNGFTIYADGNSSGYNLGDEYVFYAISDCADSISLTLVDNTIGNCTATVTLAPACCPCVIDDPTISTSDCVDGKFDIEIDLFADSGSCINYDWYISLDSQNYDLVWNGTSLSVIDLMSSDSLIDISLCTYSPTGECYNYTIENPCYIPALSCSIDYFIAAYDTTACFGEIIDVIFEFTATDFGQDGFTVTDGTASQTYALNSNLTFYSISDCADSITITMTDILDTTCSTSLTLGPACCPCIIVDPDISTTDCIDDKFDILLNPDIASGSCINADWEITVEGLTYDLIWTGNSLVASDVMATDSLITVTLCTLSPTGECFDYIIENPCFVSSSTISVLSFSAAIETNECDENGNAQLTFSYDVENRGNLGFSLATNDNIIDTFMYADYTTLAFPPDCDNITSFTFRDIEFPTGIAETSLDVCCQTSSIDKVLQKKITIIRKDNTTYSLTNNSVNTVQIELYSLTGKKLSSTKVASLSNHEINLQDYSSTLFLLRVSADNRNGNAFIKKIVKI